MGSVRGCAGAAPLAKLLVMTPWIILFAVTALFAVAHRRTEPDQPRLPAGYDGERQLAELRALASSPQLGT